MREPPPLATLGGSPPVYSVKEILYTLQGEGARTGRPAVFCRFSGCNLWSGREADRADAACDFCDTDFVGTDGPGGGKFATASDLAAAIAGTWPDVVGSQPYVVFTGGEPLLQLDAATVAACKERGFEVAVETNGTVEPPPGVDWLTVSPKPRSELRVTRGHELKLVYPHDVTPQSVEHLDFPLFYLQPLDGPERDENTARAIAYCRENPSWRLSVQTHKILGIP
ncbi:MAG: 7-carboxy-7-deazaguanine synthase [Candidatus Binatia bacterium]|nr:7-carboxy-7-deazaguanine synthase [Candidatus Binatia bacterium]